MRVNMAVETTCIQHVLVPSPSVVSSACSTGSVCMNATMAATKSRRRRDVSASGGGAGLGRGADAGQRELGDVDGRLVEGSEEVWESADPANPRSTTNADPWDNCISLEGARSRSSGATRNDLIVL
jgi:hypothetical protein